MEKTHSQKGSSSTAKAVLGIQRYSKMLGVSQSDVEPHIEKLMLNGFIDIPASEPLLWLCKRKQEAYGL